MARLLVSRSLRPAHRQVFWLVILLSALLPHRQIAAQSSLRQREPQRTRQMWQSGFFDSFENTNTNATVEGFDSLDGNHNNNNAKQVEDEGSDNVYLSKRGDVPVLDAALIQELQDAELIQELQEKETEVNVTESSSSSSTTVVQGNNNEDGMNVDGTNVDGMHKEGKYDCWEEDWHWTLIKHEIQFVGLMACVILADFVNNKKHLYVSVPVQNPIIINNGAAPALPVQNENENETTMGRRREL
eukprot:CAMPEP_0198289798 /NCGR_PEP_ID=MMETSP1449-20131203/7871_1 /TAXON_ID=420275 /ORGANISM="Attheya septentrionalis, Strain CCMP2084" /LENGTH=243 /DNA_ID=CAMNT_0043988187 /DNA_START=54 /DNA_END=785 /DNA_ORIENTATION=-